ncbi:glycoside hydrolase family 36 protein [Bifidobacterium cebidarum]|uniref:Membrane protein insertase YidC n=1 Tax=Bifidobacterium cebidarum TaxID=2650773 RepID=A0A6I1GM33_9BIFI|nr:glycoside hydrolase family 36 protein [Bifidobacterium cebidarum]KAB7786462.1 alpha-galactosidase [Bifidobacterium cebidarum]
MQTTEYPGLTATDAITAAESTTSASIANTTILRTVSRNGITAQYRKHIDSGIVDLLLVPEGSLAQVIRGDCAPEPLIQAKIIGDDYAGGYAQGRTMRNSPTTYAMRFQSQEETDTKLGETIVTTRFVDERGLEYTHNLTFGAHSHSVRIDTEVVNVSHAPFTFEMLSSFTLGSLSPFSEGIAENTLMVHRMRSTWSAEGRLDSRSVEDLQLEPDWQEHVANSLRFGCVGSFPVRGWVPFIAVEDRAHDITWAAATTHASSWQIEAYRKDNGLAISGGIADREFGHWTHTVQPGERFVAPSGVLTVVHGGVDEASQALAGHVRERLVLPASEQQQPGSDAGLPIIFNEFCSTWGLPTEQSVLAQVEQLKGHGVEYVVMDAGWFDNKPFSEGTRFGAWQVSKESFPHGIKYVVDAIHQAGMKAGVWFEFEVVGRQETECFNREEWLLKRDGIPITSDQRRFWDMRNAEVQAYLHERVIDFLRDNGFDYIKVDYNETLGIGCETPGKPESTLGDGLYDVIQASQAFFRQIRQELPNVVVEICSSGGHRLVQSFMEIGAMASFSDAHECDEIPLIAANMHRIIEPRQSQIWAVMRAELTEAQQRYRLASGFLGRLCLSGDMGLLSAEQWRTIDEALSLYGTASAVIDHGVSVFYGTPITSYRRPQGWQAIVRHGTDRASGQTLVVLHTFAGMNEDASIELPLAAPQDWNADDAASMMASHRSDGSIHMFARNGLEATVSDGILRISGLRNWDSAVIVCGTNAQ